MSRRILLAPVTVSPTKPLTPTHLKYLLALDILTRASRTYADVEVLYRHETFFGSPQVAGFWRYLDRQPTVRCYDELSEEEIGQLYLEYHRSSPCADEPAADPTEIHPVSARLLDLWQDSYHLLGLTDPTLGRGRSVLADEDELIGLLTSQDLAIDGRRLGAPVFLDATAAGLPLRPVRSAAGQSNYLLYLLRELLPVVGQHDVVVLAHDIETRTDYQIIQHILRRLGSQVVRFETPRVRIDGVARSTRHGGWLGTTLSAIAPSLTAEFGLPAFRLGLRLYLVAGLGPTAPGSFTPAELRRWTARAARLTAEPARPDADAAGRYLAARAGSRQYADPYLVASALLNRDDRVPTAALLDVVLGERTERRAVTGATVARTLLHRRHASEAFLTEVRPGRSGRFVASAALPVHHAHYNGVRAVPANEFDLLLLLECCRQAETYAAHTLLGVPADDRFALRSWQIRLSAPMPAGAGTLTMVGRGQRTDRAGVFEYRFDLVLGGSRIGDAAITVSYLRPPVYAALRRRGRTGVVPLSDQPQPTPTGLPTAPDQVGRTRATDTVLLDAAVTDTTATARLRIPLENISYFDHPLDHVPGLLQVEAARQLATLAAGAWSGRPAQLFRLASVRSEFHAYTELDRPVTMKARATGDAGITVVFAQGGRPVSETTVGLTVSESRPVPVTAHR